MTWPSVAETCSPTPSWWNASSNNPRYPFNARKLPSSTSRFNSSWPRRRQAVCFKRRLRCTCISSPFSFLFDAVDSSSILRRCLRYLRRYPHGFLPNFSSDGFVYFGITNASGRWSFVDSKPPTTGWYRSWCGWRTSWTPLLRIRSYQNPSVHRCVAFTVKTTGFFSMQLKFPTWLNSTVKNPWLLFKKKYGTLRVGDFVTRTICCSRACIWRKSNASSLPSVTSTITWNPTCSSLSGTWRTPRIVYVLVQPQVVSLAQNSRPVSKVPLGASATDDPWTTLIMSSPTPI